MMERSLLITFDEGSGAIFQSRLSYGCQFLCSGIGWEREMVFRYSSLEGVDKPLNNFKNDGSFLETFKKLQSGSGSSSASAASEHVNSAPKSSADPGPSAVSSSASGPSETPPAKSTPKTKPAPPIIGKRRGGRILPTGKVKKIKNEEEAEESPKDAWSMYLREVKKYRETTCQEEDSKTRPLVK